VKGPRRKTSRTAPSVLIVSVNRPAAEAVLLLENVLCRNLTLWTGGLAESWIADYIVASSCNSSIIFSSCSLALSRWASVS